MKKLFGKDASLFRDLPLTKVHFTAGLVPRLLPVGLVGRRKVPHLRAHLYQPDDTRAPAPERQLRVLGDEARPNVEVAVTDHLGVGPNAVEREPLAFIPVRIGAKE